uniref:Tryptophan synthase alpha chain n=1 Tax=Spyridia filamentosa TaxID=196632 RepID=A0A1Z1MJ95_SPYFI|nr:Tryptophan synthase alpha subunit [Spyridia filamentosa]ARW66147.1 Tryptophan synthase alpha subunit [Spyridia filamentosa]
MNAISDILRSKHDASKCSLIPFITAGYPNLDTTTKVLRALDEAGADIIELGIPYSDALADGFVIQESSRKALLQGVYVNQVLDVLKTTASFIRTPIVIFTYYNPIIARGILCFISEISHAGAKGLIIPDLPLEEADYMLAICCKYNIELILFVAPTSSENRIKKIVEKSPGCIYLVSSTGVTGVRQQFNLDIDYMSQYIKNISNKYIIIGFGISNSMQVRQLSQKNIDGIVVGSAFVNLLANDLPVDSILQFCKTLKQSIA